MKQLFIFGVGLLIVAYVLDWITPRDDTDPPGGRSGVVLITDHATGCQYLRAGWFGTITPRIGTDYMQMGCKGFDPEQQ